MQNARNLQGGLPLNQHLRFIRGPGDAKFQRSRNLLPVEVKGGGRGPAGSDASQVDLLPVDTPFAGVDQNQPRCDRHRQSAFYEQVDASLLDCKRSRVFECEPDLGREIGSRKLNSRVRFRDLHTQQAAQGDLGNGKFPAWNRDRPEPGAKRALLQVHPQAVSDFDTRFELADEIESQAVVGVDPQKLRALGDVANRRRIVGDRDADR